MAIKTRYYTETGVDIDGKPYRSTYVEYKCDQCLNLQASNNQFCYDCAHQKNHANPNRVSSFYAKYGLNK